MSGFLSSSLCVRKLTQTIKRSRAAELLDRTPRCLVRWEQQGKLTPIKINCRSVVYLRDQVEAIMRGEVQTSPGGEQAATHTRRSAAGTFTAFTVRAPVVG